MGLNLKRTMKGAALEGARLSASVGAGFVARGVLGEIRVEYDPPAAGVRYPGGARAAACISVDFDVTEPDRYEPNRTGTRALLELSEKYGVPITWAICGKTAVEEPDSYRMITGSQVKQEVGVHTFSHMDAQKADAVEFEEDIKKCIDVLGLPSSPKTFIFPWNRENHFQVIRKLGFTSFRGKDRAIGAPVPKEGLQNIRPVYYVDQKSWGSQSLMTKYMDLCVSASSVFHLWTHPWSIVMRDGRGPMSSTLEPVFRHLRDLNRAGDMALCTMGELADHFGRAAVSGGPGEA